MSTKASGAQGKYLPPLELDLDLGGIATELPFEFGWRQFELAQYGMTQLEHAWADTVRDNEHP